MWRVALRDLRKHWGRFLMTLIAVILGIAFLTGTLMLRGVLDNTFKQLQTSAVTAPIYVQNRTQSGAGPLQVSAPFSAEKAASLKELPEVAYADPVYKETGAILDTQDQPISIKGAPTVVFGLYGHGNDPRLVQGKAPQGNAEVGVEKSMLGPNLRIGDVTKLILNGKPQEVKVTGAYTWGGSTLGAAYVFMQADALAPDTNGRVSAIAVAPAAGYTTEQTITAIDKAEPELVAKAKKAVIAENNKTIDTALGFINTFLLIFVAVAIFVGAFIISNSFRMSVRARQREFALLRAIGASTWNVFSIVLTQALVLGVIGSALGIAAGVGFISLYSHLSARYGIKFVDSVPLTSDIVIVAFVLGVLVTVVGALLPAREAATTAPIQAMRSAEAAARARRWPAVVISLLLLIPGSYGLILAAREPDDRFAGWYLGLGAAAVIVGVLVAAVALVPPVAWILSLPLRIFRPQGLLALRNVIRHQRRTAATASALIIGIALVTAGAVLAASTKASTADIVDKQLRADLVVKSVIGGVSLPPDVIAKVQDTPGVGEITHLTMGVPVDTKLVSAGGKEASLVAMATSRSDFETGYRLLPEKGSLNDFGGDYCFVSKALYNDDHAYQPGATIELKTSQGTVTRKIGAVVSSIIVSGQVLCDEETISELAGGNPLPTLYALVHVKPGYAVATVQQSIKDTLHDLYIYTAVDQSEVKSNLADQVDIVLGILYALLGLSIVIAVLGIVNTLGMSVSERVREIAMIRAVGMQRGGIALMIIIESIVMSIFGALLGIAAGAGIAVAVQKYAASSGLTELVIPWTQLLWFVLAAAIVGIIAALLPAIRAARKPILRGIAAD